MIGWCESDRYPLERSLTDRDLACAHKLLLMFHSGMYREPIGAGGQPQAKRAAWILLTGVSTGSPSLVFTVKPAPWPAIPLIVPVTG